MSDEVEERFKRIERNLDNTAAINAKTAELVHETRRLLNAYIEEGREGNKRIQENLNAFITESREGRKNLEANMNAFLQAMMGRKNGKT